MVEDQVWKWAPWFLLACCIIGPVAVRHTERLGSMKVGEANLYNAAFIVIGFAMIAGLKFLGSP